MPKFHEIEQAAEKLFELRVGTNDEAIKHNQKHAPDVPHLIYDEGLGGEEVWGLRDGLEELGITVDKLSTSSVHHIHVLPANEVQKVQQWAKIYDGTFTPYGPEAMAHLDKNVGLDTYQLASISVKKLVDNASTALGLDSDQKANLTTELLNHAHKVDVDGVPTYVMEHKQLDESAETLYNFVENEGLLNSKTHGTDAYAKAALVLEHVGNTPTHQQSLAQLANNVFDVKKGEPGMIWGQKAPNTDTIAIALAATIEASGGLEKAAELAKEPGANQQHENLLETAAGLN